MISKKERQKQEKNRKKELQRELEVENSNKTIIVTISFVLVIFILFYVITTFIVGNRGIKYNEKASTPSEIQYVEILAGETFNMKEDTYYVLFYDFDSPNASYYSTLVNQERDVKVYSVDLGNRFNTSYVSDETNKGAWNVSGLRVKEATLIKIENGKNVFYFEGELLEIKEKLL